MIKNTTYTLKLRFALGFTLLLTTTAIPLSQAEDQKPKYGPDAVPLSVSQTYFKTHFPPLFWKMIPYYVHQQNKWSCGVVSSVMTLNAARAILNITPQMKADEPLFYEEDFIAFLKKDKVLSHYYEAFSKRGMGLQELLEVIKKSVKDFKINTKNIEAIHLDEDAELQLKEKRLHDLLKDLEKSDRHLIIANFNQGVFTGDADVGHYSPVAAYDSEKHKVLILDTDRQWYEPYWVSENVFLKGMKTRDKTMRKNRGYIHIELPSSP